MHFWQEFTSEEVLHAVKVTLIQSFVSALASLVVGFSLSIFLPKRSFWMQTLLDFPLGVPAIVSGLALIPFFPSSFAYSFSSIIIAHAFINIPWATQLALQGWAHTSQIQKEAAKTLGASKILVLISFIIPALAPYLASAFLQIFSFCSMSFLLVIWLGGGPPIDTLETLLFAHIRTEGFNLTQTAPCLIWQLLIGVSPWLILYPFRKHFEKKGSEQTSIIKGQNLWWITIPCLIVFTVPYLWMLFSIQMEHLWDNESQKSLFISFKIAFGVVLLNGGMSFCLLFFQKIPYLKNSAEAICFLLSGVSPMALGGCFLIFLGPWMSPFSASLWPLIFLQSIHFLPISVRFLKPLLQMNSIVSKEASFTLGASFWFWIWHLEFPKWRPHLITTTIIIVCSSLGESSLSSLLYNESRVPLPLLISRWMSQYHFDKAMTLGSALLIICFSLILFKNLFSNKKGLMP